MKEKISQLFSTFLSAFSKALYNLFISNTEEETKKESAKLYLNFKKEVSISDILFSNHLSDSFKEVLRDFLKFYTISEISFYVMLPNKIIKKTVTANNFELQILDLFNFPDNVSGNILRKEIVSEKGIKILLEFKRNIFFVKDLEDLINLLSQEVLDKYNLLLGKNDELTGLMTRKKFYELLKLFRQGGFIFFDVDNFKSINDTYGHKVGDMVLEEVANILKNNTKKTDFVVRWGGEELIVFSPSITDLETLYNFAERLRKKIKETSFPIDSNDDRKEIKVTISGGISLWSSKEDKYPSLDEAINTADLAMYEAKKCGKNQICKPACKCGNKSYLGGGLFKLN